MLLKGRTQRPGLDPNFNQYSGQPPMYTQQEAGGAQELASLDQASAARHPAYNQLKQNATNLVRQLQAAFGASDQDLKYAIQDNTPLTNYQRDREIYAPNPNIPPQPIAGNMSSGQAAPPPGWVQPGTQPVSMGVPPRGGLNNQNSQVGQGFVAQPSVYPAQPQQQVTQAAYPPPGYVNPEHAQTHPQQFSPQPPQQAAPPQMPMQQQMLPQGYPQMMQPHPQAPQTPTYMPQEEFRPVNRKVTSFRGVREMARQIGRGFRRG